MPFSQDDLQDLLLQLDLHPEWRAELRRRLLSDELLELPVLQQQLIEQVQALARRMAELAAAVESLALSQQRTRQEVGSLSEIAGALAEADAQQTVMKVLRQKGYEPTGRPGPFEIDYGEIDVAVPVRDSSGTPYWVLVESKARLRRGDVFGWEARLQDRAFREQLELKGVTGLFLPYLFGLRVYADAQDQAREFGIGVIDREGEIEKPAPRALK